jgi:hypothetical protein
MSGMFRYIPSKIFWVFIIAYVTTIITIILWGAHAFGAEFKFNQTKEMEDEGRKLQFCIHNTKIKIPDVDEFCGIRYGGLNTTYGESVENKTK